MKETVQQFLVAVNKGIELMGESKDHMEKIIICFYLRYFAL